MLTPAELVWLIAAVAKGDEAAFERLYAATRAKLYGVVLRILRRQDLAEEVIQEAYVKIWNSAGQFNPALASPITWMAPRETLWRGAPYLTATGSRRGGYSGGLRQDLEQRRTVQSGPRFTDYVDGIDRAQPGDRRGAQEE